ncbi:GMC family oxidoreductase [Novosphingobium sp. PY1]|uniref:GMC family oxidoreductase n=1 Tax=Novosphingobium sp. PY1 TaxID=1882221 RepID=UPI000BE775DE|nr:GMC family oxidoreductase N-terminal domain-containing protein [Novosphingobium sp. PY1]BBA74169.1 glucose-methanol-choline oxidoreductase [Novosphingobium sp. PY1]GFM31406.1 glucose-methanol-choline oxidoreductase [Novosphingobium sp. PY1]
MNAGIPDIIVVGGGSAGSAMAGRLCEAGLRVAVIEAGCSDRHVRSRIPALTSSLVQNPQYDWCYGAEPDPSLGGRADTWPAGRMLGGGSALNGMMFIRGHRWDYDNWARLGALGWDYDSVLPYFRRIEDNERGADEWRGTGGPISVSEGRATYPIVEDWIKAAANAGLERSEDLNGERTEGVDYVQVSQRRGTRCSSARGYLENLPAGQAPHMVLDAQVLRICFENGRAAAVIYRQAGQERELRARCGVVVAAGAIGTPRLLMHSGLGPAEHLGATGIAVNRDLPGVGANLQEHVGTHIVSDVAGHTLNNDARGLRGAWQVLRFAAGRKGALTTAIGHAQAFVKSREDLPAPNLQLAFSAFAFDLDDKGRLALRRNASVSTLIGLMRPCHRGRVSLRSADPMDHPVIAHRLLGSDDDIEQLVEGIGIARSILASEPMASSVRCEIRPGETLRDAVALREYVKLASVPLYHPCGTARIGRKDDPCAVVDPDLKVIGVEGLWVADASVMPAVPAGNTNATAIMIGDKGADHVLSCLTRA